VKERERGRVVGCWVFAYKQGETWEIAFENLGVWHGIAQKSEQSKNMGQYNLPEM